MDVIIDFHAIEKKWREKWEKEGVFKVSEKSKKKKFYCLEMFPYPSGEGLHIGHAFNYVIGDIYARFKRMQGFNVLYPMGYDAFGLPAENAAIKAAEHPKKYTEKSIKNFILQQKLLGLSYDWTRIINTSLPEYYKWNQYFFLQFLKRGLAYRKKAAVNYCSKCKTVLANEQVHNGKCWRHEDTDVEIRQLEQWFLRTTSYADEILGMADGLNWPEKIKIMQKNWIGKSKGIEILFEVNGVDWPIFTTRPDTLFGVTFLVISAQHPRLMELVSGEQRSEVELFLKKLKSVSERELKETDKEGVFTGSYALHPFTGEKVPIWAGNFVVADYGSGIVMAVPGHDQRDFDFAKKYKLPIKAVVKPIGKNLNSAKMSKAYEEYEGVLFDSGVFSGLHFDEAQVHITKALETKGKGKAAVQYKLRDWLISRQRYWGTPIPIVYCSQCGIVPVAENELPVLLPEKVKFGEGNPLVTNDEFVKAKCPKCSGEARRETDTMDTFFDSSWYFLRFCSPKSVKEAFDKKAVNYWMPVDQYIGGAEHACMHLIYARFFTKVLRDFGMLKFDEPFVSLFNQGLIHGADGNKMSKSLGNVVNPMDVIEKYSSDALRLTLVSLAASDKPSVWKEENVESGQKFICSVYNFFSGLKIGKSSERIEHKVNSVVKKITAEIEHFHYNIAIILLRELLDAFEKEKEINEKDAGSFLKLFSVFCPHIAEELWQNINEKEFVSLATWPVTDEKKINAKFDEQEIIFENVVSDILNILKLVKEKKGKEGEKVFLYVLPIEKDIFNSEEINKRVGKQVKIFAVNDVSKFDPENRAKRALPGRPAIYVE